MNITTKWKCDSCGEPILGAREGWAEWQSGKYEEGEGPRAKGLRLVHAFADSPQSYRESRCQYDRSYFTSNRSEYMVWDVPLAEMTGPEGPRFLLRLVREGALPKDALLEMIRRLHFEEAKETDVISNDHDLDLLSQETIERILGHASRFDDCELCPL